MKEEARLNEDCLGLGTLPGLTMTFGLAAGPHLQPYGGENR